MKIAIIGAGISGLACAYYLARDHQVTVFESEEEIGGHTATKSVTVNNETHNVDTGFIVYNDWTYPNFMKLLDEINVQARPSEMSFSVTCEQSGLEYAGSNLNTLFADRTNLLRPSYWRLLKDIVRFNRNAIVDLETGHLSPELTLRDYLADKNFGKLFAEKYLVPMGAAIWSATTEEMNDFPALFFVRFFKNHGLLSIKNRPQWHTIVGGSKSYLPALTESFKDSILTSVDISRIVRTDTDVIIDFKDVQGMQQRVFDKLVFATHSDVALELLSDATTKENEILSGIAYRNNEVVLHTDTTRLPWRERAWSSWNYRLPKVKDSTESLAKLTYNMNILQGIRSDTVFCVSLNQTDEIDSQKILGIYHYSHPVFTANAITAQNRWAEIAGIKNTWYCGAYWANGFHEDGVVSALRVVESIGGVSAQDRSVQEGAEVA